MANSGKVISTTVKLDGVEAVKKSLEALGKAGAAAFKSIRDAADKISPGLGGKLDAAVAKLKSSLKQIQDNAKNVANQFGKLRVATTRLGGEFLGVAKRIGLLGGAILGAGATFVAFTKNAADNADAVGKSAEALGLSVKSFQSLEFAANQANISSEDFGNGFAKLSKLIGDGLAGDKAAIKKLEALGIAYKNAKGQLVVPKTNQEAFLRFADTIAKIQDPAKRAAIAGDLLGKSYAKWIPLLSQGRQGIAELQDQFNKSGAGFTDEETKKADAFGDALDFLGKTLARLRDKVFLKFADPLTDAFGKATDFIIAHSDDILNKAQELADAVGPIFEDVINALLGNDKDVKNQWVLDLRDGIKEFGAAASDALYNVVIPALQTINDTANTVADWFNKIFGTDINGKTLLLVVAFGSLTGVFGLLATALGVISASFGVLSSILGPIILGLATALGLPALVTAGIVAAIAGAAVLIYAYWDDIVAYAGQAWELMKGLASDAGTGIAGAFRQGVAEINGLWDSATQYFKEIWDVAASYVSGAIGTVKDAINGVITAISNAISRASQLISKANVTRTGRTQGRAMGGYISGPGTGTSDSIPAYLSNGEFVIRAAAVRRYGTALFAALNGMRLSPSALGRFAMGGLVGFPAVPMTALPATAGGPTSTLNLVLDGQTFGGLTGPADTIKSLERAIKARRIRATGRINTYER